MNNELLAAIVKDSLLEHGSAVLPDFGKFALLNMPASFSDRGFTINPPYKKVVFTAGRFENDGFITGAYSKSNSVEPVIARGTIAAYLDAMKSEMQTSGVWMLPGLGRLKCTRSGEIFFVPDENLQICPYLDMLQPLSLKSRTFVGIPAALQSDSSGKTESSGSRRTEKEKEIVHGRDEESSSPEVKTGLSLWKKLLISIFAAAAVFLLLLFVLGRTCPDVVDPFLYSTEEMLVIKTIIP